MARYKTRKQKVKADSRPNFLPQIEKGLTAQSRDEVEQIDQKVKSQTTVFSQNQVNLLYKDLAKTLGVTLVVVFVLLSIFWYMR